MPRTDPVSHLHRFEVAPPRLLDEVRALGPRAVPALRALLEAPGALLPHTPARWAAVHAGPLYGELAGADAVPRLLEIVCTAPPGSDLQTGAVFGLATCGAPEAVRDAVLNLSPPPADREPELLVVLVSTGLREPAIAARLREHLAAPRFDAGRLVEGALLAARYGDPALADDLRAAFDSLEFPAHDPGAVEPVLKVAGRLLEAVSSLVGEVGEDRGRAARLVVVMRDAMQQLTDGA